MKKFPILVMVMLVIAIAITLFNNSAKNEKVEENNQNVEKKSDLDNVEENVTDEVSSPIETTEVPTTEEKFDTKREEIKDVPVDIENEKEVAEKFVEALLVLRSGEKNDIALNRMKNITTESYFKKTKQIFEGREEVKFLNLRDMKSEENVAYSKDLPKGYKAINVTYSAVVQYPNNKPMIENSNYLVIIKTINGKHFVNTVSL